MENERQEKEKKVVEEGVERQDPSILEEITIEELAVDGICGIY
jgi:mycofactocin precursor